jgi:four helix bundle suffix protein
LLNVARASFEELLLDFEDFLRHRRLALWAPNSAEAAAVRQVPQRFKKNQTDRSDRKDLTDLSDQERWALYAPWLEHENPAVRANALICLINQANYLLDHQIAALERQFAEDGGYSEQLAAARLAERSRKKKTDPSDGSEQTDPTDQIPDCPQCGKPMVLRTAKTGKNLGKQFWGCSDYPDCRGVLKL